MPLDLPPPRRGKRKSPGLRKKENLRPAFLLHSLAPTPRKKKSWFVPSRKESGRPRLALPSFHGRRSAGEKGRKIAATTTGGGKKREASATTSLGNCWRGKKKKKAHRCVG